MKKMHRLLACTAAAVISLSSMAVTVSADWHKNSTGYYYTLEDGDRITGWQTIGDYKYYFNNSGYAVTGFKKIKNSVYYFDPEKRGRMATGFKTIEDNRYYFGDDGVMRTGWKKIGGKTYYFSSSGKAATGKVKISGKSYTFSGKGVLQSSNTSSKKSSSPFAKSTFGKSKCGDLFDDVIKDNNIKNYTTMQSESDYYIIGFQPDNYIGSTSENSISMLVFDGNDKLIASMGFDQDCKSLELYNKYASDKYTLIGSEGGVTVYADSSLTNVIMTGNSSGGDIIMELPAEYMDKLNEALEAIINANDL